MEPRLAAVLENLEKRWQREQEEQAGLSYEQASDRVDDYLLPVGPETGRLMSDIIRAGNFRNILEVGSSYGYSTLWLADAARAVGGKVVSLEKHPAKIAAAKGTLKEVDLVDHVAFLEGDALESIASLPGPFDFVLIDLWKDLYVPCLTAVRGKVAPGGIIIADNMLFPPASAPHASAYRESIRAGGDFDSVLLPIGAGIELSVRRA